ncbi:MAG TPA: hypothetical protein VMV31_01130 [Terriglobales bacterium]|nr:hypothetical protein [Terriglobales bacterium]
MATELTPPAAPAAPAALRPPGAFEAPEQEAAFFYGLFLRGYSYQELRHDIEVPAAVQSQWQRTAARDPGFASMAEQMLAYRRRVLGIFQALVASGNAPAAVQ